MTKRNVKTSIGRDGEGRSITVQYDFGDNLSEMVKLFGEAVVYNHALDNMVIALQAKVRGAMKGTEKREPASDPEIVKMTAEWKPAIGRTIDPAKQIADMKAKIARLTPEQLAELGFPVPAAMKPALRKTNRNRAA